MSEVFKKGSIDSLDEETLFTIQKFFENNLNVSETSRKLFVHRNTLVYRLEKIKKLTGLDLREFDNAIVLKVALMVKQYLKSERIWHRHTLPEDHCRPPAGAAMICLHIEPAAQRKRGELRGGGAL